MLKALHEELDKAPAASPGPALAPAAAAPRGGSRARPLARQSGAGDVPVAPPAQQGRARKRKPGTSSSTSAAAASTMSSAIPSAFSPATISAWSTRSSRMLGASHTTEVSGKTLREVLIDGCLAGAGAGYAVRTVLLHHRRRAAREGAGAGAGRGSRRRRRDARRDGGAAEILRRPSASRSLRRGAGAAAAAALFDLLVAQRDARQAVADGRLRALRDRQAQAARAGLDLPRRAHQAGRRR